MLLSQDGTTHSCSSCQPTTCSFMCQRNWCGADTCFGAATLMGLPVNHVFPLFPATNDLCPKSDPVIRKQGRCQRCCGNSFDSHHSSSSDWRTAGVVPQTWRWGGDNNRSVPISMLRTQRLEPLSKAVRPSRKTKCHMVQGLLPSPKPMV